MDIEKVLSPAMARIIAVYVVSPLIATIPLSLAGFVNVGLTENYHLVADIDIMGLLKIGVTAALGSAGVYLKWGAK